MFKKLTALACFAISIHTSFAQQVVPCITDELHYQQTLIDPLAKAREEKANILLRQQVNSFAKAGGIVYIPVVFHVIYNAQKDSAENISQAQIMDQIRILNEDYRRKVGTPGANTDPISADMQIEFRLAQYDPNGNKHDGINRINSTLTSDARDNVKALSYWDSNKYLNVWVVKSINSGGVNGTVLGYAQFPWDQSSKPKTDGIVVRSDQIGVIGTGQTSQGGRTLSHEIGHWLGLYHTFQGGCTGTTSSNCATQGDQVCDTPPVATSSSGCNKGQNSCTNDVPDLPDLINDYMDYSDGTCMNIFTAGQKARVYNCLPSYRNTIYGNGTNNVAYAGINPADGSYNAVPASTLKLPVSMDFEGSSFADKGWIVNNFSNPLNGWQNNALVSYSGASSMYMHNFTNTLARINGRDGFQSPEYDLTSRTAQFASFYYAYAQRSTSSNDSLLLFVSNDFGMTEQRIFGKVGSDLATAPSTTSEFIPTAAQWKKVSINLASYSAYTHARFRFEFVNRRGNNIYVDDFKIDNGLSGIDEQKMKDISFTVFPNPMNESSTISFDLTSASEVKMHLYDIAGKEILTIQNGMLPSGKQEFTIHNNFLKPGMYFLRFEADSSAFSYKLLVN